MIHKWKKALLGGAADIFGRVSRKLAEVDAVRLCYCGRSLLSWPAPTIIRHDRWGHGLASKTGHD